MCSRSLCAVPGGSRLLTKQCDMQQLTIQFEGFADERRQPVEVGATTQRVMDLVSKAMPKVVLFGQAALAVSFGFGVMFLAALIGG